MLEWNFAKFYNIRRMPVFSLLNLITTVEVNRWPVTLRVFSNQTYWWLRNKHPNFRSTLALQILAKFRRQFYWRSLIEQHCWQCVNIVLLSAAGKMKPTPNYFHFQDALNETSTLKCLTKLWWRRASERCMQHAIIMLWYAYDSTKHNALYHCCHIIAATIIWHLVSGQQCVARPLSFCQAPAHQPQAIIPSLSLLLLTWK